MDNTDVFAVVVWGAVTFLRFPKPNVYKIDTLKVLKWKMPVLKVSGSWIALACCMCKMFALFSVVLFWRSVESNIISIAAYVAYCAAFNEDDAWFRGFFKNGYYRTSLKNKDRSLVFAALYALIALKNHISFVMYVPQFAWFLFWYIINKHMITHEGSLGAFDVEVRLKSPPKKYPRKKMYATTLVTGRTTITINEDSDNDSDSNDEYEATSQKVSVITEINEESGTITSTQ